MARARRERPGWIALAREDVHTALLRDPAAHSRAVVVLSYPGIHALWHHRCAHLLWRHGRRTSGRLWSQFARWLTGIEIHPAASIGRRCFIDHGMGVVIGETAVVGDDVLMYHGVTLGSTVMHLGRRHPTIGDRVVIGAGAKVLGPVTVGDGARIGANAVVLRGVPVGATAIGVPARLSTSSVGVAGWAPSDHDRLRWLTRLP